MIYHLSTTKSQDIIRFAKKRGIEDEIGFLKKNFRPDFDTSSLEKVGLSRKLDVATEIFKDNLDLYVQIDDYIKSKEKKVCKDMPRIYRNMKEHVTQLS